MSFLEILMGIAIAVVTIFLLVAITLAIILMVGLIIEEIEDFKDQKRKGGKLF